MKFISAGGIKEVDRSTLERQNIVEPELMTRVGQVLLDAIRHKLSSEVQIHVVCGMGNNGGDGLVLSELLLKEGQKVNLIIVHHRSKGSTGFTHFFERLTEQSSLTITHVDKAVFPKLDGLVIDALLGAGINRPAEGLVRDTIQWMNALKCPIYSVDVPSGMPLFPFESSSNHPSIVRATITYALQQPKLTFYLPEYGSNTGEVCVLDIGLDQRAIDDLKSSYHLFDPEGLQLKIRQRFTHKGDYGHALLIAGSTGMFGASVLAANGCLKGGCGLLTVHVPSKAEFLMHCAIPDAMLSLDLNADFITMLPDLKKYDAIGIGPGMALSKPSQNVVEEVLNKSDKYLVIDADALNLLAQIGFKKVLGRQHIQRLVLTPHQKEFDRLFGSHNNTWERIRKAQKISEEYQIVIVLKGAYTAVIQTSGEVSINSSGTAAMATAGSGDVLTGLITSLLARGYNVDDAAKLGVYIHGKSGELAEHKLHTESVTASNIAEAIPGAYEWLETQQKV